MLHFNQVHLNQLHRMIAGAMLASSCGLVACTPTTPSTANTNQGTQASASPSASASGTSAQPSASAQPTAQPSASPAATEEAPTKLEVSELDILDIPETLVVGTAAVALKAQVVFSDGSRSNGVLYSVDNSEVLAVRDGYLQAVGPGTAHVIVRALKEPSVQKKVAVVVTGSSESPAPSSSPGTEPVVDPGADPGADPSATPAPDLSAFQAYYLPNYHVGMRWEYQVGLTELKLSSVKPLETLPKVIPFAYNVQLVGASLETLADRVRILAQSESDMGLWTVEVVAVAENAVSLRSEFVAHTDALKEFEGVEERVYTPADIGACYSDFLQVSEPEQREVSLSKEGVTLAVDFGSVLVDQLEGESSLNSGPLNQEFVQFWLNAEQGLVQKRVRIKNLEYGNLFTETELQIQLTAFSE